MAGPEEIDAVRLDASERRILIELQGDARLSNQELAQRVGWARRTHISSKCFRG